METIVFIDGDEAEAIEYEARRIAKQRKECERRRRIMREAVILSAKY